MMLRKLVTTFVLLSGASAFLGCMYGENGELVGTTQQGMGGTGTNNISPQAVDALSLSQGVTDDYGITNSAQGITDPLALCIPSTITKTGCKIQTQWENWLNDSKHSGNNAVAHQWMMKGVAKCAAASGFTFSNHDGSLQYPGQWPVYKNSNGNDWTNGPLQGQVAHETVSACILTLLNGNNESLALCIIGPGGSPLSDACDDTSFTVREGGYFGDLFASTPSAYVVGPEDAPADVDGRNCYATQGTYCCDELDTTCTHHIFRAGSMTGTDSRCNGFQAAGSNEFCTSYWTEREPGRTYSHGFTTFIPQPQ